SSRRPSRRTSSRSTSSTARRARRRPRTSAREPPSCPDPMTSYRIASIGGDGVGPEVVAAARSVLDAVAARDGFAFEWLDIVAGGAAIDAYGTAFRPEDLDAVAACDAILLGAVGGPRW